MEKQITIDDFSQHLFWDVEKVTFDLVQYKIQMIGKVLEYGNWNDWLNWKKYYDLQTIEKVT